MAVLGYACIGTNNFEPALAFYDQLFAAMGGRRLKPTPIGILYKLESGAAVMIVRPYDGQESHAANGPMLAFRVDEKAEVSALHALALSCGATSAGPPGPRDGWGERAYVRDPDGNKLALLHRERKAG